MEGYGPSSYGDAFADVYDDWYRDLPGTAVCVDRLRAIAADRPVLELGAGTGRLAIALASRGGLVVALDASSAMLQRLRHKLDGERMATICADMARPPLVGPRFAVVVVAFNTFFNLGTEDDQRSCLDAVRELLLPDGVLVIETLVFPDTDRPVKGVDASVIELDRVVLTASRLDPAQRSVIGQHIELTEHGVRLRPWVLHYLLPRELDDMAEAAGFTLDERSEGWDHEPFTDESTHQVAFYRRR